MEKGEAGKEPGPTESRRQALIEGGEEVVVHAGIRCVHAAGNKEPSTLVLGGGREAIVEEVGDAQDGCPPPPRGRNFPPFHRHEGEERDGNARQQQRRLVSGRKHRASEKRNMPAFSGWEVLNMPLPEKSSVPCLQLVLPLEHMPVHASQKCLFCLFLGRIVLFYALKFIHLFFTLFLVPRRVFHCSRREVSHAIVASHRACSCWFCLFIVLSVFSQVFSEAFIGVLSVHFCLAVYRRANVCQLFSR